MPLLVIANLPLPPSANEYYENRAFKGKRGAAAGKTFIGRKISAEGLAFRQDLLVASRAGHVGPARLPGRLTMVVLLRPARRGGDLDNRLKPLQDALQKAEVILNDNQFDDVRLIRGEPVENGSCSVSISRFDPRAATGALQFAGISIDADMIESI